MKSERGHATTSAFILIDESGKDVLIYVMSERDEGESGREAEWGGRPWAMWLVRTGWISQAHRAHLPIRAIVCSQQK